MIPLRVSTCLLAALCLSLTTFAQERKDGDDDLLQRIDDLTAALESLRADLDPPATRTDPELRFEWYAEHTAMQEHSPYQELAWKHLGPTNLSGRVTDVAVATPRGETYTLYIAAASGGVWKTENEGVTWESIFNDAPTQSVGDIALAPSDQQQIWVGTGEANIFRSSMAGCGVWRSLDGGETWEHQGLGATHTIARIVIHPTDPNIVYVAATGNEWTKNPERGVYRTKDGGENWELVLFVSDEAGANDLVMDPVKPEILYASTWQRTRKRWNDPRTEPWHADTGIWRSMDGGDTWEALNEGLPEPKHRGRIGIDVAHSNPNVIYAFIDNYEERPLDEGEEAETDSYGRPKKRGIRAAEIYRSDDRGDTWRKTSESDSYMARIGSTYGWVFGQLRVDPNDEDTIYIMGLALNVSNDSGESFRRLGGMHGDHHALWIDPDNSDYLVNGNDGGVVISYDGGEKWRQYLDNLPVVQFYNVGYDMAEPFNVYGSIQDHGSSKGVVNVERLRGANRGSSRARRWRGSRGLATEWKSTSGGEASYHQVDPSDPDTLYAAGFYGSIGRTDQGSGQRTSLPLKSEDEELRGQWLAPFLISPHNPRIIYHGMNRLFRSMDRGENFAPISPDLTRNDPDELGDIPFQTITSISESPFEFGRIFVGTDDGNLHVTFDSGKTWELITDGLREERWISRVIASRWTDGVVYAAQNGKRWDDLDAYLWKSEDDGATWRSISGGIPGAPINVVREDPKNEDLLYVGTDLGVYVSTDRGESWAALGKSLPVTYVHDLVIHPRDDVIVVATHGRGMWALDARPLQDPEEWEKQQEANEKADERSERMAERRSRRDREEATEEEAEEPAESEEKAEEEGKADEEAGSAKKKGDKKKPGSGKAFFASARNGST